MKARRDLIDRIMTAQSAIYHAAMAASTPVWANLDLSMAQMKMLRMLSCWGPATIGQLAETLGISQPTASQLVDRLVQAGLAERAEDPEDRRRTVARPSAAGQRLLDRLAEWPGRMREWLARLSPDELDGLHHGMEALARIADDAGRADRRVWREAGRARRVRA